MALTVGRNGDCHTNHTSFRRLRVFILSALSVLGTTVKVGFGCLAAFFGSVSEAVDRSRGQGGAPAA